MSPFANFSFEIPVGAEAAAHVAARAPVIDTVSAVHTSSCQQSELQHWTLVSNTRKAHCCKEWARERIWPRLTREFCCLAFDYGCNAADVSRVETGDTSTTREDTLAAALKLQHVLHDTPALAQQACNSVCTLGGRAATCLERVRYSLSSVLLERGQTNPCAEAVSRVKYDCPTCDMCSLEAAGCDSGLAPRKHLATALGRFTVGPDPGQLYGAAFSSGGLLTSFVVLALVALAVVIPGALLLAPRIWPKDQRRDVFMETHADVGPSFWRRRTFGSQDLRLRLDFAEDEETEGLVTLADVEEPLPMHADECHRSNCPLEMWDVAFVSNDSSSDVISSL